MRYFERLLITNVCVLFLCLGCGGGGASDSGGDSPRATPFNADDLASRSGDEGANADINAEPEAIELSEGKAAELGIDLSQFQGQICEQDWCPCSVKEGDPNPDDLFICDPSANEPGYICGWKRGEVMGGAMTAIPTPIRACGSDALFEGASHAVHVGTVVASRAAS